MDSLPAQYLGGAVKRDPFQVTAKIQCYCTVSAGHFIADDTKISNGRFALAPGGERD